MEYPLNHFKGIKIGSSKIVYSLGKFAIGNFTSWMEGWDAGTEHTIYMKVEKGEYSSWDSHISYTEHGVFDVIGFGDTLEEAIDKVNRIITQAPIYIRTTKREICPHCGKITDRHSYEKYVWKPIAFENSRDYCRLLSRTCMGNGIEIAIFAPRIEEWYCKECRKYDLEDDLPF